MFGFLSNAPAWQLILQADLMTKLVITALFTLSVFCIWIVLNKFLLLWRQKKGLKKVQAEIKKVRSFDELLALSKTYKHLAAGRFLLKVLGELNELLHTKKGAELVGDVNKVVLTEHDLGHLQSLLDQSLGEVLAEEEQYLPVLSTSAAVAPLAGLFGTVWGLVHAFVDISRNRSADIAVVAPGIAEALTTTLAGLIVSIPALIFFHYFSNELRKLEHQLWAVSDKFLNIVKSTFVK